MKKLLIIFAFVAGTTAAHAQAQSDGFYATRPAANSNDDAKMKTANPFDEVTINVENRQVTFNGLPTEKRSIFALVTDPEGESIKGMKVSADNNVMDISKLRHGMYFITHEYRNTSKKAFVIHI